MSPTLPRKGDSLRLFFRVLLVGLLAGSAGCCPAVRFGPRLDAASKAYLAPFVFEGKLLRVDTVPPIMKAHFRIVKLYKKDDSNTVVREKSEIVVEFSISSERDSVSTGRGAGAPCRGVALDAKELSLKKKYLVFAAAKKRPGTLLAVDRPEPHTKRKALARVLCDKCAKAPKVEGLGGHIKAELRTRLRLKCKFTGNPPPRIGWLKNGAKIRPNDRLRVRNKKRFSRLVIRRVSRSDGGLYECKATNVLGNASASTRIFVVPPTGKRPIGSMPTNDSTLWPLQGLPCPMNSYCLNGGTCSLYETVGEYVCECAEGYRGRRCESKGSTLSSPAPVDVPQSPHDLDATTRMLQLYWGK